MENIILDKLISIEKRLTDIENEIKEIKTSANNMDNHISFVENIYNSIKLPFHYIINRINYKDTNRIIEL